MIKVGDTVGIKEANLYTGVGLVKVEDRGIVERFALDGEYAIVRFSVPIPRMPATGTLMIRCADLVSYLQV